MEPDNDDYIIQFTKYGVVVIKCEWNPEIKEDES